MKRRLFAGRQTCAFSANKHSNFLTIFLNIEAKMRLSIPRPCNQNWNSFQLTTTGGHCTSCNKVVVDFTSMTDKEILTFFKNNSAHTCGRFRNGQLKEYDDSKMPVIKPGLPLLRAGLISILLLVVARPSSAQEQSAKSDTVLVENIKTGSVDKFDIKFTGTVREEWGDPLPGVSVWVKGTIQGTTTDKDGKFEFPATLSSGDVLVFSFIGFVSKEIKLKPGDVRGFQAPLAMCLDADIMGEVAVHQLYQEPSAIQKFMRRIGKLF